MFKICSLTFLLLFVKANAYEFKHFELQNLRQAQFNALNLEQLVLDFLAKNAKSIETEILDKWQKREFQLGKKNYGGFEWQKPVGFFSIQLERDIQPYRNRKQWQVTDNLIIRLEAETYLQLLKDQGKIKIDIKELKAFSNLSFLRKYSYRYLANDFDQANQQNFNKLFFSFLLLRNANFLFVDEDASLIRQDILDLNIGAKAEIPIYGPLAATASASYQYNTLSQVGLYRFGKQFVSPQKEFFRLQIRKEKAKSLIANASIGIDFYNLLKLSLLKGEYQYKYTESLKSSYVFYERHLKSILFQPEYINALRGILHMNLNYANALYLFKESYEKSRDKLISSSFQFLFHRTSDNSLTKEYSVFKNGVETQYILHSSSKELANENPLGGVFGWLIKIFKKDYLPRFFERAGVEVTYNRKQYKRDYSIVFHRSIFSRKLKKKKHRKKIIKFIQSYGSNLNNTSSLVESKKIQNFISLNANFHVSAEGIQYFETLSDSDVKNYIKREICRKHRRNRRCVRKLVRSFKAYYEANFQEKAWRLTEFLKNLNVYLYNFEQLEFFFEASNAISYHSAKSDLGEGIKYREYSPLPNP